MNTKIKKFLFLNLYYLLSALILFFIGVFVPIPWTITSFGITDAVNKALIKSKVVGVLSEIYGKEGNTVKSGQLLAVIKDIESEILVINQ
ncbi:MAG: biotin/lipoyl-binding protein [Endomicrobium sp.]|jgi:multidrug efflux pump subunit AcrA (membrane-fusion protein)|uniref:biotin/lipoyl-binding protein n=1 Tax=Candidatus Endomicrobiellum cubanum TaxID=3242325 RepID=UPI002819001C|nr:biotin/lipoyl-binding protein [Endomicrobium sp.]